MFFCWLKIFVFVFMVCVVVMSIVMVYVELVVCNDFKCVFDDVGVFGIFVLMDISVDCIYVVDLVCVVWCIYLVLMFKILNSLIVFDIGVVCDYYEVLFYGGKLQFYKQWEYDMVLFEVICLLVVLIYQEVVCCVGFECMQVYVDVFDYGNCQFGSVID